MPDSSATIQIRLDHEAKAQLQLQLARINSLVVIEPRFQSKIFLHDLVESYRVDGTVRQRHHFRLGAFSPKLCQHLISSLARFCDENPYQLLVASGDRATTQPYQLLKLKKSTPRKLASKGTSRAAAAGGIAPTSRPLPPQARRRRGMLK